MIALLLAQAALGGDLSRYPTSAPVELPATGAVRIQVPTGLRTPWDPADLTDLLLVDGTGREVPVARLDSLPVYDADSYPLARLVPTEDAATFIVDVGARPVDGLRVDLPYSPLAATVTVRSADGEVVGGPRLVWQLFDNGSLDVPTAPVSGELTVTLDVHGGGGGRWAVPSVRALRLRDPGVEPEQVRVPVAGWQVQENGWARYEVALPGRFPVSAVRLAPDAPIFEREAAAAWSQGEVYPGNLVTEVWPETPTRRLMRVQLGDVAVEDVRLPLTGFDDHLVVLVQSMGAAPLAIPEVALEVPGLQLVALDAGPGPHTLYAGAPQGTSPVWDLQVAAPELARAATLVVAPGDAAPNPAWVAPEIRANLVAPSTEIDLEGFHARRAVTGEGIVRIPLDDEILGHTRVDLADLRLVTGAGLQVPFLLRRRGGDEAWRDLTWERTERGPKSVLQVTLPQELVPVSSVQLTTSAPLFERTVTVNRLAGGLLEPVRAVQWVGADRPTTLSIDVQDRIGSKLVLTIENGDDPPLPIDGVEVRWPAWELVAALPAEPTWLYYDDPRREAASYDLSLLREDLRARATSAATLGEREAVDAAPLTLVDRALLAVGIGVMALGLLGLLLALIRATPASQEPEPSTTP